MDMNETDKTGITRRGFSKLGVAGVIGAALPGGVWAQNAMQPGGPYPPSMGLLRYLASPRREKS